MRIARVKIQGFRALLDFPKQDFLTIGARHAFIGKNDSGKSSVIYAIDAFFKEKISQSDVSTLPGNSGFVSIEIGFTDLPDEIQLEPNVPTTFSEEKLLDADGFFTLIKRLYPGKGKGKAKVETFIKVHDFDKEEYRVLCDKKEADLNLLGSRLSLSLPKSGAGKTNKERRKKIRDELASLGDSISEYTQPITDLYSELKNYLPDFILFPSDQSLSEEDTAFQSQFKPITENLLKASSVTVKQLENDIGAGLAKEFNIIHSHLAKHTKDVSKITPSPVFDWQKGIKFGLDIEDTQGVTTSLANRGAGIKRLLMVAYFQYLAERDLSSDRRYIFAIEEPEVFLHPSAQRDLLDSLSLLTDSGNQVLMTTHSPVFAGRVAPADITVVFKPTNEALSQSVTDFPSKADFAQAIAVELGIEPSDSLALSKAIVFIEGISDIQYFHAFDKTLTDAHEFTDTLKSLQIDFIPTGGFGNVKYWIDINMLKRLKVKYGVVLDSDKTCDTDPLSDEQEACKDSCDSDGALFYVWRYAEIECYLNSKTIDREEGKAIGIAIPKHCAPGQKPRKQINQALQNAGLQHNVEHYMYRMTADEIKEACVYTGDDGRDHYEIIEILNKIRALPT
jgi:predicted ATP-dependent endonuclease of OLD family